MNNQNQGKKGDILLEMRDIVIDGYTDDHWLPVQIAISMLPSLR